MHRVVPQHGRGLVSSAMPAHGCSLQEPRAQPSHLQMSINHIDPTHSSASMRNRASTAQLQKQRTDVQTKSNERKLFCLFLVGRPHDRGWDSQEAEVFQLDLHAPEAQHVGQGCEDAQSLKSNLLLLMWRHAGHRAHVVQAVCELYYNDPEVTSHGQEQLLQIQCLHARVCEVMPEHLHLLSRELGNTTHKTLGNNSFLMIMAPTTQLVTKYT